MGESRQGSVLVLGYFAAVHIGHRYLIERAKHISAEIGSSVTVVTFDDGIYAALGRDFREIYVLRERMSILRELGVSVDVLPVDRAFLSQSPEQFLSVLSEKKPIAIVVGQDYRFGKGAVGDAALLKSYFEKTGVEVEVCDLLSVGGKKISSTLIGELLASGDIHAANAILGSPFFISGTVVKGFENGKKLQFPTANLSFDMDKFIPRSGVYASYAYVDGVRYKSMTNIGSHPTFGYYEVNAETNIFDLSEDLYGRFLKVELIDYLRPVLTFSDPASLSNQLYLDKKKALEVLL
ncbi:MAG: riboflavin biosynthesis protein RibF [Clostridia bacterium]|nr:riboflavin biosynthesis protein RibF [Clostridia bacterium]